MTKKRSASIICKGRADLVIILALVLLNVYSVSVDHLGRPYQAVTVTLLQQGEKSVGAVTGLVGPCSMTHVLL